MTRSPEMPVEHFAFEGTFVGAYPYGCGHIHDTYVARLKVPDGHPRRYILQLINCEVFRQPEELMENIVRVTAHLREKIVAAGGNPRRETLNVVPTRDGRDFYRTPAGDYWRAYHFIEGAHTYEIIEDPAHVYHGSWAFGTFQRMVGDFPVEQLHETIPDFHHTEKRYRAFVESVEQDVRNRTRLVGAEIDFIEQRAHETTILLDLLERGELPQRVTHNDTKFNNVMIDDKTGKGICVIDLDTVMPGLSIYDFGDSVRSTANAAAEDERDLSQVFVDLDVFEQLTRGYLDAARHFLAPREIDHMVFSTKLMTLECGIRFLTDYLSGDVYYKIHRPDHNLDRCRNQFKLVEDIEAQWETLEKIVTRYR